MKDQWTVLIDDTAQDSVPQVEKSQVSRVKGALCRHHPMDIHSSVMHKQMASSVHGKYSWRHYSWNKILDFYS